MTVTPYGRPRGAHAVKLRTQAPEGGNSQGNSLAAELFWNDVYREVEFANNSAHAQQQHLVTSLSFTTGSPPESTTGDLANNIQRKSRTSGLLYRLPFFHLPQHHTHRCPHPKQVRTTFMIPRLFMHRTLNTRHPGRPKPVC